MKYVLIGLLKLYRLLISPLYGNVCRYYPSCSAYALRSCSGSWSRTRQLVSGSQTAALPSVGSRWV